MPISFIYFSIYIKNIYVFNKINSMNKIYFNNLWNIVACEEKLYRFYSGLNFIIKIIEIKLTITRVIYLYIYFEKSFHSRGGKNV